jgi:hypothetical protein
VLGDDLAACGKAKGSPSRLIAEHMSDLLNLFENDLLIGRRHADAGVGDDDLDLAVDRARLNRDRATGRHSSRSVADSSGGLIQSLPISRAVVDRDFSKVWGTAGPASFSLS